MTTAKPDPAQGRPKCPVHQLPWTADTWTAQCTCPSDARGIEESD